VSNACPVIVFAKAPVPGFAKTRLAMALGGEGAAALARRLLERAVQHAVEAGVGPVELCCTPDANHTAFADMAARHGVSLTVQGDGDLGERMHRALVRTLHTHRRALLTGTDVPSLDAALLRDAARLLLSCDAVFGPAVDGGYTVVGLTRPHAALFDGIVWSTPGVMRQTRERIATLGLRHAELPLLPDIDEPADLVHLPDGWHVGLLATPPSIV
jgi:uncharacterized protein